MPTAVQIEAQKRGEGRKTHTARTVWAIDFTVWATDFTVWATENPVADIVSPTSQPLQTIEEGYFCVRKAEFLINLTKGGCFLLVFVIY